MIEQRKVTSIACVNESFSVGYLGLLLYKNPEDRKRFRKITTGGICVMGRRTFEEIGRPLEDRINVIMSKTLKSPDDNSYFVVSDISEFIELINGNEKFLDKDIFVIGGHDVWKIFVPYVDSVILTHVPDDTKYADTKFPQETMSIFRESYSEFLDFHRNGQPIIQRKYDIADNTLISSVVLSRPTKALMGCCFMVSMDEKNQYFRSYTVKTNIVIYRKAESSILHAQISQYLVERGVSLQRAYVDNNGYVCMTFICHNPQGIDFEHGMYVADVCMIGNYSEYVYDGIH